MRIHLFRQRLNRKREIRQPLRQLALRRGRLGVIAKDLRDRVCRLQRQRELPPKARVVGSGIERRKRRHHRRGGEIETLLAMLARLRELLDDAGRGRNRIPADPVLTRHGDAAVQDLRLPQNFSQQVGLGLGVALIQHGRADRRVKALFRRQRVVFLEERHGLLGRHPLRVLRKRLRGNADGLHLVAALPEDLLCRAEKRKRLRDLLPVFRAVEVDERGDGADLRLLPHLLHEPLRADAWRQDEKHRRDAKGAEKRVA